MWKNISTVRQARDEDIIRRMGFACWTTKATDTHTHTHTHKHTSARAENVIFIAFPRQQWLSERVSLLHLCVHCLPSYTGLGNETGKFQNIKKIDT